MAIDVTVGGTASNSYASVAEADAYLAVRGDTATWTALAAGAKELKLQWAAIILGTLYFAGSKATSAQALEWPRSNVLDRDGWAIFSTIIPVPIKNAQAELAFQLIASDWTQGLGPVVNETVKVGSIDLGRESHRPIPAAVLALLRPYLAVMPNSGGRLVRG